MAGDGGDNGAADARRREEERQARISQGVSSINEAFSQFDDPFFQKRQESFLNYQTPQLEDQFEKARKKLVLTLSRQGLSQSSTANQRFADLQKDFGQHQQTILGNAKDFANQERTAVEQSRGELINQVNATGDANLAAQNAQNRAGLLSAEKSFSPLGQLFADATAGLATQADLERRGQNTFSTGLFKLPGGQGSSRVVG